MKTYICLFFLLFCSVYSWGQSLEERMATAIDIGTYSEPFTYEDTQSTANFNCGFIPPTDMDDTRVFISKDIFYKLTVTQPMKIRASAKPSITDSGTLAQFFGHPLESYDLCGGSMGRLWIWFAAWRVLSGC